MTHFVTLFRLPYDLFFVNKKSVIRYRSHRVIPIVGLRLNSNKIKVYVHAFFSCQEIFSTMQQFNNEIYFRLLGYAICC